MADTAQALGAAIRRRRERAGISVHGLGRIVGMDPSLLSKVERGIVQTDLERYALIAAALNVPLANLFRRTAA